MPTFLFERKVGGLAKSQDGAADYATNYGRKNGNGQGIPKFFCLAFGQINCRNIKNRFGRAVDYRGAVANIRVRAVGSKYIV